MTPAQVTDQLDRARLHVLAQYRRQRVLGREPATAMGIVRDANAAVIAELVCLNVPVTVEMRARYQAALEYSASIIERPVYWHNRVWRSNVAH